MNARLRMVGLLLTSLLLAGCSTIAVDRSFGRVQDAIADREPSAVAWPTSSKAREHIDKRVADLLDEPLDQERAVAIALINNRQLRGEYARIGLAEAELVEAGLLDNPSLSVGVGFPDRPPSGTELDFGLTLSILQWLLIPAREDIATIQLEAEVLSVAHAVLETATETRLAFLDLQAALNMSAVLREIAVAAEASYQFATRVHDAGNLSDLALANDQALYEQSRVEYARSLANAAEQRERLNVQLGLWGAQTDWSVVDRLPPLPSREPDLADLESLAIRQRLDLAAAAKEVEVISKAAGLQRDWRYLLTAEVGANAMRDTDGQWVFGPALSLELPIFNQRQGQIARLDAERLASEARLEALAIEVRSDVRRLRDSLFAARYEAEHFQHTIIPLRERITALTQEQYNFMLVDTFDLLAAKRESIASYREYIDSVRYYWEMHARLQQAVGGRLPIGMTPDSSMSESSPLLPSSDSPAMHEHGGH